MEAECHLMTAEQCSAPSLAPCRPEHCHSGGLDCGEEGDTPDPTPAPPGPNAQNCRKQAATSWKIIRRFFLVRHAH